jgi:hypothetical protein
MTGELVTFVSSGLARITLSRREALHAPNTAMSARMMEAPVA